MTDIEKKVLRLEFAVERFELIIDKFERALDSVAILRDRSRTQIIKEAIHYVITCLAVAIGIKASV